MRCRKYTSGWIEVLRKRFTDELGDGGRVHKGHRALACHDAKFGFDSKYIGKSLGCFCFVV